MVQAILADLGASPRGRDRLGLVRQLNEFLLDRAAAGVNVAVFIDEAQNLTDGGMERVRLLSNLETDQHKLMQIVLSGQPELDRRIGRPELRQLRQRIMVRCTLRPLDEVETGDYIRHRMGVAGADGAIFADGATRLVHRRARGIPRLINKICDRALLAAYASNARCVGEAEVRRSLRELEELM
jgi:general secretion pathway protein A